MIIRDRGIARKIIFDPVDGGWPARANWRLRKRYAIAAGVIVCGVLLGMALRNPPSTSRDLVEAQSGETRSAVPDSESHSALSRLGNQSQTESTIVHNGVTIVSPHLLV